MLFVNEQELVKNILKHICDEDYKILINKVWFRGFWVPGVANQRSNKKWRPEIKFINNDVVLGKRIRKGGKYNYELLMEAMVKMAEGRNEDDLIYNALRWIKEPDSHQEIEEYFKKLESDQKENKEQSEDLQEEDTIVKQTQNNQLVKEYEDLKAEIKELKDYKKKYKEERQNMKIKCSNLEQENNRLKKENNRLIRENEKISSTMKQTEEKLNQRIITLSVENSKLKTKENSVHKIKKTKKNPKKKLTKDTEKCLRDNGYDVKYFDLSNVKVSDTFQYQQGDSDKKGADQKNIEVTKKILCITKNPSDVLISDYDIYFLTDLDELNHEIYTDTAFEQIWYVRSGFTHADLIKIVEKYQDLPILQAKNWKLLQKKIKGADEV